jgi:hypothetical protein
MEPPDQPNTVINESNSSQLESRIYQLAATDTSRRVSDRSRGNGDDVTREDHRPATKRKTAGTRFCGWM